MVIFRVEMQLSRIVISLIKVLNYFEKLLFTKYLFFLCVTGRLIFATFRKSYISSLSKKAADMEKYKGN